MRADRVEIIGDDQVFGLILKPIETMRELLGKQAAKPQVDCFDDHLDQVPLGGQKGRRVAGLKGEMGAQPFNFDAQAVRIFVDPIICLVGRPVPIDDAAVARDLELRIGEEVLERAPEHHLVKTHDPGYRPASTLDSHRRQRLRELLALRDRNAIIHSSQSMAASGLPRFHE